MRYVIPIKALVILRRALRAEGPLQHLQLVLSFRTGAKRR
jgi:hypothetical protein